MSFSRTSVPLAIPNARYDAASPPRYIDGWGWGNDPKEGNSLSGPAMSQQLHGERHLQQKNQENSSHAYDKKLLSKIDKPKTPHPSLGSIESSPTSNLSFHQQQSGRHLNQLRSLSFPYSSHSNSACSDPPIKKEASSGCDSPRSSASYVTTLDQHSLGISPSSEQQQLFYQHNGLDSPYVASINQGPRNTRSQQCPQAPLEIHPTPPIDQKSQNFQSERKNNATPNMKPPSFICGCCKRPKKFDTVEELGAHESEKQYSCSFCPNRFKKKNEAERHENSLHLRKHSWSCASLDRSFDSAFYPSTNTPPVENSPSQSQAPPSSTSLPAFDTCLYCGEQFPNEPAPDWEARGAHLNGVHKFGKCKRSKKFFRADQFRQHLKRSHAGKSGKWRDTLETACMRDENGLHEG